MENTLLCKLMLRFHPDPLEFCLATSHVNIHQEDTWREVGDQTKDLGILLYVSGMKSLGLLRGVANVVENMILSLP